MPENMRRITNVLEGARRGWIVWLECGHRHHLDEYPRTATHVRCWKCDEKDRAEHREVKHDAHL